MALSVAAPVRWISAITARVVALAFAACSGLRNRDKPASCRDWKRPSVRYLTGLVALSRMPPLRAAHICGEVAYMIRHRRGATGFNALRGAFERRSENYIAEANEVVMDFGHEEAMELILVLEYEENLVSDLRFSCHLRSFSAELIHHPQPDCRGRNAPRRSALEPKAPPKWHYGWIERIGQLAARGRSTVGR
jgi:hypothetical protein